MQCLGLVRRRRSSYSPYSFELVTRSSVFSTMPPSGGAHTFIWSALALFGHRELIELVGDSIYHGAPLVITELNCVSHKRTRGHRLVFI